MPENGDSLFKIRACAQQLEVPTVLMLGHFKIPNQYYRDSHQENSKQPFTISKYHVCDVRVATNLYQHWLYYSSYRTMTTQTHYDCKKYVTMIPYDVCATEILHSMREIVQYFKMKIFQLYYMYYFFILLLFFLLLPFLSVKLYSCYFLLFLLWYLFTHIISYIKFGTTK